MIATGAGVPCAEQGCWGRVRPSALPLRLRTHHAHPHALADHPLPEDLGTERLFACVKTLDRLHSRLVVGPSSGGGGGGGLCPSRWGRSGHGAAALRPAAPCCALRPTAAPCCALLRPTQLSLVVGLGGHWTGTRPPRRQLSPLLAIALTPASAPRLHTAALRSDSAGMHQVLVVQDTSPRDPPGATRRKGASHPSARSMARDPGSAPTATCCATLDHTPSRPGLSCPGSCPPRGPGPGRGRACPVPGRRGRSLVSSMVSWSSISVATALGERGCWVWPRNAHGAGPCVSAQRTRVKVSGGIGGSTEGQSEPPQPARLECFLFGCVCVRAGFSRRAGTVGVSRPVPDTGRAGVAQPGQARRVLRIPHPSPSSRCCRHAIELLEMSRSVPVWVLVLNPQPPQCAGLATRREVTA